MTPKWLVNGMNHDWVYYIFVIISYSNATRIMLRTPSGRFFVSSFRGGHGLTVLQDCDVYPLVN